MLKLLIMELITVEIKGGENSKNATNKNPILNRARPGAVYVQGAINRAPTWIPIAMNVHRQQCLLAIN